MNYAKLKYNVNLPEKLFQVTGSNKVTFQLNTFTCNEIVLFAVTLLFTSLLSVTANYHLKLPPTSVSFINLW